MSAARDEQIAQQIARNEADRAKRETPIARPVTTYPGDLRRLRVVPPGADVEVRANALDRRLGPSASKVLPFLRGLLRTAKEGYLFVGSATVARAVGVTVAQAKRARTKLVQVGLLENGSWQRVPRRYRHKNDRCFVMRSRPLGFRAAQFSRSVFAPPSGVDFVPRKTAEWLASPEGPGRGGPRPVVRSDDRRVSKAPLVKAGIFALEQADGSVELYVGSDVRARLELRERKGLPGKFLGVLPQRGAIEAFQERLRLLAVTFALVPKDRKFLDGNLFAPVPALRGDHKAVKAWVATLLPLERVAKSNARRVSKQPPGSPVSKTKSAPILPPVAALDLRGSDLLPVTICLSLLAPLEERDKSARARAREISLRGSAPHPVEVGKTGKTPSAPILRALPSAAPLEHSRGSGFLPSAVCKETLSPPQPALPPSNAPRGPLRATSHDGAPSAEVVPLDPYANPNALYAERVSASDLALVLRAGKGSQPAVLPTMPLRGLPQPPWELVPPVRLPQPPTLRADSAPEDRAHVLALAYRGAVAARTADPKAREKLRWVFGRGNLRNGKSWGVLVRGAEALLAEEIAPATWAAWSVDVWRGYVCDDPVSQPPVGWVWSPKRIADRSGWFRDEEPGYRAARTARTPVRNELARAYSAARNAILRERDGDPKVTFDRFFPGGYEQAVALARRESDRETERLRVAVESGEFVW